MLFPTGLTKITTIKYIIIEIVILFSIVGIEKLVINTINNLNCIVQNQKTYFIKF